MHRLKASAALLLTAFFAVAGSFHHHPLPKYTHDHAGFCSAAASSIALESCAICKVAHTTVHLAAQAAALSSIAKTSRSAVTAPCAPPSAGSTLLSDPRAPPTA